MLRLCTSVKKYSSPDWSDNAKTVSSVLTQYNDCTSFVSRDISWCVGIES